MKTEYSHEKFSAFDAIIGETRYQISSVPITSDIRYFGSLILFQDVTQFMEGERMQQRFIADASHELKTPIAAIKGMIEILRRPDFKDLETQTAFLSQIEKENRRLESLVNDLIQMSRLSSGKIILQKTVFKVYDVLFSCFQSVLGQLSAQQITWAIEGDHHLEIYADAMKFTQIIQNLLNNAISHSQGKSIHARYEQADGTFTLWFSDTGNGIAPDDLNHIFERFYRGSFSRNRQSGGSGLGLAITKQLVEAHQGTIDVESTLGKGTTFVLKLTEN